MRLYSWPFVCFAPDDGGGSGGDVATEDAAAPEVPVDSPKEPEEVPADIPLDEGGTGDVDDGDAKQYAGVRQFAQNQFGANTEGFESDEAYLHHLHQQAQASQQRNLLAEIGEQAYPHWSEFQNFIAQKQQEAAVQQQKPKTWHEGFSQDPLWNQYLQKSTDGQVVPAGEATVPPGMLEAYQKYQLGRQQWLNQLVDSPSEALKPFEQHLLSQVEQMVEHRLGERERLQQATQIIGNNPNIYQLDQNGQVSYDRAGNPVMSQYGANYHQALTNLRTSGALAQNATPQMIDLIVRSIVGQPVVQQAPPVQTPTEQNQQRKASYVQSANRIAGARNGTSARAAVDQSGLSLAEKMEAAFKREGVTVE